MGGGKLAVDWIYWIQTVPPTLRAGDFNLDGWNDFVGLNAETKVLEVYRNVYNKQNSGNVFEMYSQDRALLGMEDIIAATFFDVDDSGRQDILTVHSDGSTRLVWNNNKEDADFLFFKGTVRRLALLSSRFKTLPLLPLHCTLGVSAQEQSFFSVFWSKATWAPSGRSRSSCFYFAQLLLILLTMQEH